MTQLLDKTREKYSAKLAVLKKRRDFLRIAGGRVKWVSKTMIVQQGRTPAGENLSPCLIRVGYTASKKVGNAVRRNRARRRLREAVRLLLAKEGEQGHDYVLIARTATLEAPYDQLIRDFGWCLKRLKNNKNHDKGGKIVDRAEKK